MKKAGHKYNPSGRLVPKQEVYVLSYGNSVMCVCSGLLSLNEAIKYWKEVMTRNEIRWGKTRYLKHFSYVHYGLNYMVEPNGWDWCDNGVEKCEYGFIVPKKPSKNSKAVRLLKE